MGRGLRRARWHTPWQAIIGYAALMAAGVLLFDWLDLRGMSRLAAVGTPTAVIAAFFLALGVAVGWRLTRPAPPAPPGNPAVADTLGISAREMAVLHEIAAGGSTREIAARLHVSPNTVKTHVARLFDKLGAHRRTEALARARSLGLIP